jgi:nitrite reductase/ring-hydroxylating ferredoxin subunit
MADYYSIIARAVGGLDPNTGAARRRLYDRARVALVAEMRSAENALDEADILVAQASLERAILKIEADAFDNRCPHMGFPLDRGSVEDGILTCHWHHARFDLASGCTFDLWADDVPICPVEV